MRCTTLKTNTSIFKLITASTQLQIIIVTIYVTFREPNDTLLTKKPASRLTTPDFIHQYHASGDKRAFWMPRIRLIWTELVIHTSLCDDAID